MVSALRGRSKPVKKSASDSDMYHEGNKTGLVEGARGGKGLAWSRKVSPGGDVQAETQVMEDRSHHMEM